MARFNPRLPAFRSIAAWIRESNASLTSYPPKKRLSPGDSASIRAFSIEVRVSAYPASRLNLNWCEGVLHTFSSSLINSSSESLQRNVATVLGWNDIQWTSDLLFIEIGDRSPMRKEEGMIA